ncbi:torsin-like protein [Uranotaenia lowii]|uniref:torsin-like protein n=1 Tax=Uranotaenia lowii TaxID=190385 RepID=UPI00247A8431|nr:torsin-like protein [Uranotaenia lowii]
MSMLLIGLSLICAINVQAFDPFSISAALSAIDYSTMKKYTFCKFKECCQEPYLISEVNSLKKELTENLYGQHIVVDTLVNAIGSHLRNQESSRKPLVMSFHGPAGTGKNYVSDFIVGALYSKGFESKFVHKFNAFDEQIINLRLHHSIKDAIYQCPNSLFIFDEVEKMPEGIFDSLVSLLDSHAFYKQHDFTKAIFIFLSNSGGAEISQKLKSLVEKGQWRDNTKLPDFERIVEMSAYNMIGGMHRARIIEAHVIDHFIPFLPLESRHVEMCIKKEFLKYCRANPSSEAVSSLLKAIMTLDDTGMFSNNGCKRISKKVEAYCYNH